MIMTTRLVVGWSFALMLVGSLTRRPAQAAGRQRNAHQHVHHCTVHRLHTTHTHTRLTALCPGLPGWAGTRKVKPIWILLEQETVSGSGISWAICKSAPCSRQITTPAPHYSSFFTGRMPFLTPNQQCQSTEGLWCVGTPTHHRPVIMPHPRRHFVIVCLSHGAAACLGYRHTGCLQL